MGATLGLLLADVALLPVWIVGLLLLPLTSLCTNLSRTCFPIPPGKRLAFLRLPPTSGSSKPRATLVFVHGWPDSYKLFTESHAPFFQARGFECVHVALPKYYDQDPESPLPPLTREELPPPRRYGYALQDVASFLDNTIKHLKQQKPDVPVLLVVHDWGCLVSYAALTDHADCPIAGLAALDIGMFRPSGTFALFALLYQGTLNVAWELPWPLGDCVTRGFGRRVLGVHIAAGFDASHMGYLYRNLWHRLACGPRTRAPRKGTNFFFGYGDGPNRPAYFRFWDDAWIKRVQATSPTSRAVPFPGGHWFFMGKGASAFDEALLTWFDSILPSDV